MKALFVPVTEAQMAELQGLAEHGCLDATVGSFFTRKRSINEVKSCCGAYRNDLSLWSVCCATWAFEVQQLIET